MTGARFTLGLVGYAHHDLLDRPPGDTSLWRFLDFAKFVDMLDRETLFFARADTMIDPWEGRIGDRGLNEHVARMNEMLSGPLPPRISARPLEHG
jgi:hypothetical protein